MAECTIYDKLRYIAETKDLIKAAIEAQDVEVLESATFRQYAEYITQIRKVSSVNGMQGDVTITAKDLGALTEIPSEYITETELNEKGYLTAVPDVYITEDELSSQLADKVSQNGLNEAIEGVRNDIPTNVSQLTNDSGYITLNEVPKVDLSGYALKSEIPDISVKQDKLTAGNGISINNNVISLDYEYDLFEVVQSLPTENISDNKVYLLLDSNGSEGNTYVEYLYVNGQWEELGKFKVNVDLSGYATEEWVNGQGFLKEHQDISNLATKDELNTKQDVISDLESIRSGAAKGATALQTVPSGYATEQWVNEQGFLKEHQDISNLATKEELNTKQDVISDLETIRSGASKGATALQSVPSTYALKTDILSAKTDTRYTTYDVQNPVLSGKTIILQNEVTDSRKYHTLGFDKISTTIGFGNLTKRVVMNSDGSVTSDFDDYTNVPIDFSNITGDGDVIIINYVGTYANHNDDGTTYEGDAFNEYITYNKQTKILKYSERQSSFAFAKFSRSDNGENVLFPNSNEYDCSQLPEDAHLIWNIYVSSGFFYTYTAETQGNLFVGETTVNANTSSMPDRKNEYFRYENDVKAYILTDKNTTFKTINGEQITGNGDITIDTNVDLTPYATKEELNTKQDVITDLDSIRSGASLGATALQSVPSGYATEQWVNEQGFLKEHQDISNLATKAELNAKQDTISDLETIRSGAALGATALQSVPSTYALKTDILSAKTDTRYTTYEVQNPILSGKTIILQNEVTDSRKYHTIGYDKTITTSVPVQKYINITRNYNGVPSMDTDIEGGIGFHYNEENGVGNMGGDIPFTLDKINAVTNLLHYEVSYADNSGETIVDDVIYDPNTKLLSVSDGRFGLAQIRKSDNGQHIFGGNTDGNEYLENGRWYYNFEQHPLQEGVHLIFEPYYSSNLFWNFSLTLNGMFYQESSVTTDDKPNLLNDYIRYSNNVKAYILTDKNTTFKTINGQQITGNGDITIDTNVDLSGYATKSELATKQDTITDLETIRSGAAKGATALQSVPSGYATEQWVSEQGFLKEHQDISNLATKTELNAKQDTINDLETIRSGAAKGETALQSVPNTYALKSEIPDISVKQDKLTAGNGISITDNVISLDYEYDLFEVVPSLPTENISDNKIYLVYQSDGDGNNLYIEYIYASGHWEELGKFKANVDLSGYATEEWVNTQGFLKEHQDISNLATKEELNTKQDTISDLDSIRSGAEKGATALQSVPEEYAKKTDIPDISTKQDVIPDLEEIRSGAAKGATALQSVPDTYATEQWVNEQGFLKEHQDISNLATKEELNAKQDTISDLDTIRSGAALGSTALQSVPSEYVTETELNNKGYLTSVPDTYALKSEIPDISVKQDTLVSGTNIKTINGESILGSGNITIEGGGNVDLTNYYTKTETNELVNPKLQQVTLTQAEYDALSTKEDNVLYIISDAEDLKFKTINGQQITGEGNIEIEASADNVPTVQTTPNGTTSNYIYSTINYTNPQYSVISDISNFITYSTDKASIATWKQYWGQESANSHQNWSINAATTSQAGLMSSSDKTKLDGIDLSTKQDTLVSGTNIKTINGISLLGEGNISISGEGVVDLSGYYTKAEIDEMIGGASATITQINNLVV